MKVRKMMAQENVGAENDTAENMGMDNETGENVGEEHIDGQAG